MENDLIASLEKAKLHYSINGKYDEYQKACEYITTQSCLISKINSRLKTLDTFGMILDNFQHRRTVLLMCLDRITERINNKFKEIKSFE